jgi:hypothetical protein
MKNDIYENIFDFVNNVPDEVLIQMTIKDWRYIESLCLALTLDIQVYTESKQKQLSS